MNILIKRPIEDFLSSQGTLFGHWLYLAWMDIDRHYWVDVDYAGKINAWVEGQTRGTLSFSTEMSGSVTEGELEDGRTEVTVVLRTKNAITHVRDLTQFGSPAIFGSQGWEVVYNNLKPALADCTLKVKYITTAPPGSVMPDLLQLAYYPKPGQVLLEIIFSAEASGQLHGKYGVKEGTAGMVNIKHMIQFDTSERGCIRDKFLEPWPTGIVKIKEIKK